MAAKKGSYSYEDALFRITKQPIDGPIDPEFIKKIDAFETFLVDRNGQYLEKGPEYRGYSLYIKDVFIQGIFENCCGYRWVDIEKMFYARLVEVADSQRSVGVAVNKLNEQLDQLKERLKVYLSSLAKPGRIAAYETIFQSAVMTKDRSTFMPERIMILDFNYTDTSAFYVKPNVQVVHLHGECYTGDNPLIFGYADELDAHYTKFRLDEDIDYVKNMKSNYYTETNNYLKLEVFLDLADFEVALFGHSCGKSDKTVLNMIFEHPKCRHNKIHYHEDDAGDNFRQISDSVSRHCDSIRWYSKVVPKIFCSPMPQWNESPVAGDTETLQGALLTAKA
jgi:hypothetical protein